MSEELTSAVALAIFVQHQKNEGHSKSEAEELWRAMGSVRRGVWRLCAKAAFQAQEKAATVTRIAAPNKRGVGGFRIRL